MKLPVRRLISPAGFLIALVFFLLPFATLTVEARGVGSVEASYSGLDLITGAAPSMTGTGRFSAEPGRGPKASDLSIGSQVLAVLTALLLLGGLIATLTPMPPAVARARGRDGVVGLSVVTAGLLVATEMVFTSEPHSGAADAQQNPGFAGIFTDQTGIGFWLSVLILVLVFGFAAGNVLWDRMERDAAKRRP